MTIREEKETLELRKFCRGDREKETIPVTFANDTIVKVPFGGNANMAVIGPPGCGKTFSNLLPNLLLSTNCSMVVDDKKGYLYQCTRDYFMERGYRVLKFDTAHFNGSCVQYNPFDSIVNKDDILRVVHMLLPDSLMGKDPFWIISARDLAACIIEIGINITDETEENFNFEIFFELMHEIGRKPEECDVIDAFIQEFKEKGKSFQAMEDYGRLKGCSDNTWTSIVVTLEACMQRYRSSDIMEMTKQTTIDLKSLGKSKTILYVVSSDIDDSKYPLVQLFYQDICYQLVDYADTECGKTNDRLPIHVRFLIDDFASGVQMNQFPNIVANCRSRNISYMLCFQSIAQLMALYGLYADSILDCMEFQVFYPTTNISTVDYISKAANIPRREIMQMKETQVCVLQRCSEAIIGNRNHVTKMPEYKMACDGKKKTGLNYGGMGFNG